MSSEDRIAKLQQQLNIALGTIKILSDKVNSLQDTIDYRGSLDKLGTEIWTEKHDKMDTRTKSMIQRIDGIVERIDNMEYNINMNVVRKN